MGVPGPTGCHGEFTDAARARRMKVLILHNHYVQPGGEDQVFAAEAALLEREGHQVTRYAVHNTRVAAMGRLALAGTTIWSRRARHEVQALIRAVRPDLMHVHNTLPLLSPSVYYAAHEAGIPVVQTLHNFRLVCPNAMLFRDGHPCEDCVGKRMPWPGLLHACYRGSRAASAVTCGMLTVHNALRTWQRKVDVFIVLTEFARQTFIRAGMPPDKLFLKPNFLYPDPKVGGRRGGYALFAGRLAPEKGVATLLSAWERLEGCGRLKLIGDGPLAESVRARSARIAGVEFAGLQPHREVIAAMREAAFLVFPSVWPEGFPLVLAEAMASGLAVICGDSGGPASLIRPGHTGIHFRSGDPEDLASKIRWMQDHPAEARMMGDRARQVYERELTAERNYELLMESYGKALHSRLSARGL